MRNDCSDEKLCERVKGNDRDAEHQLVERYSSLVRLNVRPFFLAGGDNEDLLQEGMIGLLDAIREFDPSKSIKFGAFASVCIRNRVLSAVRAAARLKHLPLSDYCQLDLKTADGLGQTPEDYVLGQEALLELSETLDDLLSPLEKRVLGLYLKGLSYQEISGKLSKPVKSVDNAVQRIRRKYAQHQIRR